MNAPQVELVLTTEASAGPVLNLYPLYLHDVSSYEHLLPNRHGVLTRDDSVRNWQDLLARRMGWWRKPGELFPYLICVGSIPVGFNLIASAPHVPCPGVDFVVHEFFLAHACRGTGIAAEAARKGFTQHPGSWEVATWTTAPRAIRFWRKTLPICAEGDLQETEEDHPWGRRVVFRFATR